MLVVFPPIFVLDTKIYGYNFAASLKYSFANINENNIQYIKVISPLMEKLLLKILF